MRYAAAQTQNLPIGSGVVEAACKTLATERMKRSGMRWRQAGGQAILTFRALHQSTRKLGDRISFELIRNVLKIGSTGYRKS